MRTLVMATDDDVQRCALLVVRVVDVGAQAAQLRDNFAAAEVACVVQRRALVAVLRFNLHATE